METPKYIFIMNEEWEVWSTITITNKLILGNDNFLAHYNWVSTWSDNGKIMIILTGLMASYVSITNGSVD